MLAGVSIRFRIIKLANQPDQEKMNVQNFPFCNSLL